MLDWNFRKQGWLGETSLDAFEAPTNGNGLSNEGTQITRHMYHERQELRFAHEIGIR